MKTKPKSKRKPTPLEPLPAQVQSVIGSFRIDAGPMTAPQEILLCKIKDDEWGEGAATHVVWMRNMQNGGCYNGMYTDKLSEAIKVFADRVKREVR